MKYLINIKENKNIKLDEKNKIYIVFNDSFSEELYRTKNIHIALAVIEKYRELLER